MLNAPLRVDCLIHLPTAVAMIGNEGMAGMPVILGMGISAVRALAPGGGDALRMGSTLFVLN